MLDEILALEPNLETVAADAFLHKRRRFSIRIDAYERAKGAAWELVGWDAKKSAPADFRRLGLFL